jgi:predicted site-specific integrase-resolvase
MLGEKAAARRLRIAVGTLQNWRWQGKGPAYIKSGRTVLYAESDIVAWQLAQRQVPSRS